MSQTIVITGASSGMGRAAALLFARKAALGARFIGSWLGSSVTRASLRRNKSEA